MAVISRITCATCGMPSDVWHSPADATPKTCVHCREDAAIVKRDKHLAELATLPIEERLRRIEEWIYDYKPRIPLSEMRF